MYLSMLSPTSPVWDYSQGLDAKYDPEGRAIDFMSHTLQVIQILYHSHLLSMRD